MTDTTNHSNIWQKLRDLQMVAVTPEVLKAREFGEGDLSGLFIGIATLEAPASKPDLGNWDAMVILREGGEHIDIVPVTTALAAMRRMKTPQYVTLTFKTERPSKKGTFRPVVVKRAKALPPGFVQAVFDEFQLPTDTQPWQLLNMGEETYLRLNEAAKEIDQAHADDEANGTAESK